MAELSETIKNIYNNNIHEDKMAVSCATATKKCIYEEYDEEYGVKPIFILDTDILGISSDAELPLYSI
jgi:hypothetical protein